MPEQLTKVSSSTKSPTTAMTITENEVLVRLKNCFKVKHLGSIRDLLKEKYGIKAQQSRLSFLSKKVPS